MNRYFTIAVILVVLFAMGAAVAFRGPILALFNGDSEPVATTTPDTTLPVWQQYASTTLGVALEYPPGYTSSESYKYEGFPGKPISGASFTIPAAMATGTNLSTDTRLSIEQLPRAKKCTGDIFINEDVKAVSMTDNGVEYSVASTSGAAAGNRYEETVYALASSVPCTAVRYLVHSTAIGNYPEGAVREFDQAQLMADFDKIRQSLRLTTAAATTTTP